MKSPGIKPPGAGFRGSETSQMFSCLFYFVGRFFSALEDLRVFQRGLRDGGKSLIREEGLVRGDHHVGEGQEPRGDGMLQDLVGAVLIYVGTFLLIYIQTHAGELTGADAFDQVVSLDQRAAGGVDQQDAVLHFLNGLMIDQVVGAVHERAVQGDQVALGQQLVQRHIGGDVLQIRVLEYVVCQDLHAKAVADPRHSRADLAGTHDAGGFLIEGKAHQAI